MGNKRKNPSRRSDLKAASKGNRRVRAGGSAMQDRRIDEVKIDNRRKLITISSGQDKFSLPYAKLDLRPSPNNPIVKIFVDQELGSRAVTYFLQAGEEDSVHLNAFFDYNRDPLYLQKVLKLKLTLIAQQALKRSGLSRAELRRRLGTSASQLIRLLDQTNYSKSIDQLLRLVSVLGVGIELNASNSKDDALKVS